MSLLKNKKIGVFALVMINIIAIDSLRNVPAAAEYGLSLIFYYLFAAICFFIPSSLVAAELATGWPKTGGVYVWVREAFGPKIGLLAIWLQWIENVIWYPTIMSFIGATLLFAIDPKLAANPQYIFTIIVSLFWIATFLNMLGMRISSLLSTVTALIGTIVPMLFIIGLGIYWVATHDTVQITFSWANLLPDLSNVTNLAYLTAVLVSLVGIELSASHAQDVRDPQRSYPKAMLISVIFILISLIGSSLAIAVVLPQEKIQLLDGLVQAFSAFFNAYHMPWMTAIIAGMIIIGGFGGVAAWIIGPSRGLLVATEDNDLPKWSQRVNRKEAPVGLLLFQGVIFTGLASLFLFMPSVNSSYWVLTALTSQLYMLMYFLMFIAAIRLRYKHPEVVRSYRIPFGNKGMWLVGGLGAVMAIAAIGIGFLPPGNLPLGNIRTYETWMISGFLLLSVPPLVYGLIHHIKSR